MRRYNLLQPLWLAFYSKSLYRDVRQHWQGFVFVYLIFLVALCYLPAAYRAYQHSNHFFIYPFFVLLYFIQGILEGFIYAAFAKLFLRTHLSYPVLVRLAIVAITPEFIIVSVLNACAIVIPYKWIFYFALGMGYLFFAIEANKAEKI